MMSTYIADFSRRQKEFVNIALTCFDGHVGSKHGAQIAIRLIDHYGETCS